MKFFRRHGRFGRAEILVQKTGRLLRRHIRYIVVCVVIRLRAVHGQAPHRDVRIRHLHHAQRQRHALHRVNVCLDIVQRPGHKAHHLAHGHGAHIAEQRRIEIALVVQAVKIAARGVFGIFAAAQEKLQLFGLQVLVARVKVALQHAVPVVVQLGGHIHFQRPFLAAESLEHILEVLHVNGDIVVYRQLQLAVEHVHNVLHLVLVRAVGKHGVDFARAHGVAVPAFVCNHKHIARHLQHANLPCFLIILHIQQHIRHGVFF